MFTKGEWFASVIDNEWSITSDIGRIVRLGKNTAKYPEAQANAHLIAAAPMMYEALSAINASKDPFNDVTIIHNMVNALRKAKGK